MTTQFDINSFKPAFKEERKSLNFLARCAETAERYDDMCKIMRALVEWIGAQPASVAADLTVEERNLLSVAYKNVVGARRASWRALNAEEHKDDEFVKVFKKQIESEVDAICKDVLDLLIKILLNRVSDENESRVFYLKMAADYYRYLAEIITLPGGSTGERYDQKAAEYYQKAYDIASQKLLPTHPVRLGLALNFSVCFYEILKDSTKAIDLAKAAFDNAIAKLDKLDDSSYKDSTLIMQLLRDNLTLWTQEAQAASTGENEEAAPTDG